MRSLATAPRRLLLLVPFLGSLAAFPALAAGPSEVSVSTGAFGLRSDTQAEVAAEVRFAHHKLHWLPRFIPELAPASGVMVSTQGAFFVYSGFRCDVALGAPWELSIQFAPGLYSHGNEGFKLGGPVEFRSGIELSRRLGDHGRLGLMLFHLSNAHIYVHNPGSESLVVTYGFRP
jgi:Lipid A 3-O-deacylase (PagL)